MKTIIFDMDGTLIDSSKAICVTVNEVRRELGLKDDLSAEYIIRAINEIGRDLSMDLYGLKSVDKKLRDGFEEKFKANYAKFAVDYDGVKELLYNCVQSGYFVALASNAPQDTLNAILEKNNILHYFNMVVGSTKNIPQKPDPAMINLIKQEAKFSKTLFIGDSAKDELAARNAKVGYLNVCWGFGERNDGRDNAFTTNEAWNFIANF